MQCSCECLDDCHHHPATLPRRFQLKCQIVPRWPRHAAAVDVSTQTSRCCGPARQARYCTHALLTLNCPFSSTRIKSEGGWCFARLACVWLFLPRSTANVGQHSTAQVPTYPIHPPKVSLVGPTSIDFMLVLQWMGLPQSRWNRISKNLIPSLSFSDTYRL